MMAEPRVLKLQSPAYGDPIFYKWPLVVTKRLDEPSEIAETIRLVCEDFPELKYAVENVILKDYEPKDYDSMNQLCQRYNKAMKNILQLWKGRAPPPRMFQPPNKELLRHIINLCYAHAIKEPEKLNLYEPFSPEVYGETSFDMVAQILEEIQVNSEQTFVDLGSGVGQVVLQAAASNRFKECVGVEKSETPAMYAKKMEVEFKRWMDWFGKTYTDFTLEKGDFLDDKWRDIINDCGVVFVNNFAFGPVVNHHLKTRFQTMKEGSKVISSREFVPMNFKFNKRNLSELGAMIRVSEIKPKGQQATVSWTGNSVSYFLHVVDRTRLEKYFSILKKKKDGQDLDEDEMSLCSETTNSVDSTGTPVDTERLEENLDDLYLGTTTRHQWQLLTDTINQSKEDGGKVMPGREAKTRGRIKQTQQTIIKQTQQTIIKQTLIQKSAKMQMKNKILQKYCHQKMKKKPLLPKQDSVESGGESSDPVPSKTRKYLKSKKMANNVTESVKTKKVKLKVNGTTNSVKDVKNKPLLKLRRGRPLKKREPEPSSTSDGWKPSSGEESDSTEPSPVKPPSKERAPPKTTKKEAKLQKGSHLEEEVDKYLAHMKLKYLEFIKRVNTKEYAERLKVMIECETAKKKLLSQEISETERMVQNLISDSLRNFSSRLGELDLAVKTPLDLLSKSNVLAQKHRDLENKVVHMEIEVLSLEEKYKVLCAARNDKNRKLGLEPMIDSEEEVTQHTVKPDRKKEMETKLCGAILNALNHRRSLMDQQSSLSEQISILEKISSTDGQHREEAVEAEEKEPIIIKKEEKICKPKAKPVALVPPRMLSDNKKNTISPDTNETPTLPLGPLDPNRSRRGRRRKRSAKAAEEHLRSSSAQSDSSQDSKTELDERIPSTTTIRNRTSAVLNGTTSTLSQQFANTDQQYITYQAHAFRAPITFPTTAVDSLSSESMKNTKQFLKTSGKLLKAAPSKWTSFQDANSRRRIPSGESPSSLNPGVVSNVMDELPPGKIVSSPLYDNKWAKPLTSPRVSGLIASKRTSSLDNMHSVVSNNFSLPIDSLVLSTSSSQSATPHQTPSHFPTPSYLNLIAENDPPTPQDVLMPVPLNQSKCVPPTYNNVPPLPTACSTINMDDDILSCTKHPVAGITVNMLPNITHMETNRRNDEKECISNHSNLLQHSAAGNLTRKSSSVWTSSTFSVTHLHTPETSKKLTDNTFVLTSTQSPPTGNLTAVINHVPIGMTNNNVDELQIMSNFFPLSSRTQASTANNSQSKNGDEKPVAKKKKGRQPKTKPVEVTTPGGKNPADRYHFPFAMPPEGNTGGRVPPMADTGMKRKMEEPFHRQYTTADVEVHRQYTTTPDVEDHFRTSFNKLCQDANREAALNSLQETAKSLNTSPQTSTVPAFNPNMVNQGAVYRSTHNFIPPATTISPSTAHTNKNMDMSIENASQVPSVSQGACASMIAFISDKPITTYPRTQKDIPECTAGSRDHRVGRPLAPAMGGSGNYSFPSSGSATPVYCPSTMKLLKSSFEGSKGPPVTLLIPANRNPNDVPSHSKMTAFPNDVPSHSKMAVFPNDVPSHTKMAVFPNDVPSHTKMTVFPNDVPSHTKMTVFPNDVPSHTKMTVFPNDVPSHTKMTVFPNDVPSHSKMVVFPNDVPSHTKMTVYPSPSPKVSQGPPPPAPHPGIVNNPREPPRKANPELFMNSFPGATFIQPAPPGGARPTFIPGILQESKGRPPGDMLLRPPPPMSIRGRKPKKPKNSSGIIVDPGSLIDFAKCPPNNNSMPIMNNPTNNLINAGFRPPIIRNPMQRPIQNLSSLSLDVRSRIRPRILGMGGPRHPMAPNRLIVPRTPRPDGNLSIASSFLNRTPISIPMDPMLKQKTPSPGSPTYNNPRYVLLSMPLVPGSVPDTESGQGGLQRQISMTSATSPTFPPPNS